MICRKNRQAGFPHRWSQICVWSVNIYPACEWVLQHAEDSQLRSLDSVCWALPPGFTCVYVFMCLCTQLSIPVERFKELTLHSCPCCTVNLIFPKTHLKHTHSDIYIWRIKYCICQSGSTAQYIITCWRRQEVQLLFKPDSRTGKKCDLSVFDCWTIVGARRQFEYLSNCWSPGRAQQSLEFIEGDEKKIKYKSWYNSWMHSKSKEILLFVDVTDGRVRIWRKPHESMDPQSYLKSRLVVLAIPMDSSRQASP